MKWHQFVLQMLAVIVVILLMPFLWLLSGCATTKPIDRPFDYHAACGQDDCGHDPQWEPK